MGAILAQAVLVAAWFQQYIRLVVLGLGLAFAALLFVQWYVRRKGTE